MKKFYSAALSILMIAGALTGCGKSTGTPSSEPSAAQGGNGAKTVLNVVTAGGGFWETPMAEIEADYETKHPDIDLNLQIMGYDQLSQTLEVKMGAKSNEFDVIAVDFPLVAAYTERGYIQPLDKWITAAEQKRFIESSQKASIWNNQFMAAPMESSAMLLFYNQALLEQAGVSFTPKADEYVTWEQLSEVSAQVLAKLDPNGTEGYYGIGLEQVSRPYQILPMANTLGEKGIADDGFTVDGVLNTDGWVKAMDFYQGLFEKKISPRGVKAEEMGPLFYSGKMVFYIGGPWNYFTASGTEGFDFGYARFPTFEGYKAATPTGSWHLGISSFSEKSEEAAKFIRYLTLEEGNSLWIAKSNDIPALKNELENIIGNAEAPETTRMCASSVYDSGYARPVSPGYTEWENVMTAAFEDIRNGSNPKEVLDNAVSQIDRLFQKYKK